MVIRRITVRDPSALFRSPRFLFIVTSKPERSDAGRAAVARGGRRLRGEKEPHARLLGSTGAGPSL